MKNLINRLNKDTQIIIRGEEYIVKTKTWYGIEEDKTAKYVKCELSKNKMLVIIPDDELIYMGRIIKNMKYERISNNEIKYDGILFSKTGEGHQFITKIEFGDKNEIEGKCIFQDYESENNIISLGILQDKENVRADVYADILKKEDIEIK